MRSERCLEKAPDGVSSAPHCQTIHRFTSLLDKELAQADTRDVSSATVRCQYCHAPARLVTGELLHPDQPANHQAHFWHCEHRRCKSREGLI